LFRYRGTYDHNVNTIEGLKDFDFKIHIFGKNDLLESYKWDSKYDYSILKHETFGGGWSHYINNNEIDSLTFDGYVHLHCFFNNTG